MFNHQLHPSSFGRGSPAPSGGFGFAEQHDEDEGGHGHHHHSVFADQEAIQEKMAEKKVLTRRQINRALMDMEDTSPLKHMVGAEHISPLLACLPCFKRRNIGFRQKLRFCICQELGVEIPESELQLLDNPFLMAGYGVNAYFQILSYLVRMFLFIAFCCIPLYTIFSKGVGFKGWKSFPLMRFTMGNLGGASTICKHHTLSQGHIKLMCPPGSVIDANNAVFGAISNEFDQHHYCH